MRERCYSRKCVARTKILSGYIRVFTNRKCNKLAGKTLISCRVWHYYKDYGGLDDVDMLSPLYYLVTRIKLLHTEVVITSISTSCNQSVISCTAVRRSLTVLKLQVKVKPGWWNASQRMFFKKHFGGGRIEGGASIGDAMLMMGTKAPSVAGISKCLNKTETWHLHLIKHSTGLCRVGSQGARERKKNMTQQGPEVGYYFTYYLPFPPSTTTMPSRRQSSRM